MKLMCSLLNPCGEEGDVISVLCHVFEGKVMIGSIQLVNWPVC